MSEFEIFELLSKKLFSAYVAEKKFPSTKKCKKKILVAEVFVFKGMREIFEN